MKSSRQYCILLILDHEYTFRLKTDHILMIATSWSVYVSPLHVLQTGQSPTIGSDASPDSRIGICVLDFIILSILHVVR